MLGSALMLQYMEHISRREAIANVSLMLPIIFGHVHDVGFPKTVTFAASMMIWLLAAQMEE